MSAGVASLHRSVVKALIAGSMAPWGFVGSKTAHSTSGCRTRRSPRRSTPSLPSTTVPRWGIAKPTKAIEHNRGLGGIMTQQLKGGHFARQAAMLCQDAEFLLYLDRRRRYELGMSEA